MEYLFVNKPEFAEPIRVLFLCGAKFMDSTSDKRIVLKKYLEKDKKNKVIILEKYFDFTRRKKKQFLLYYDAGLFELHSIESLAALVATNIIIIHETISTAGEIGVFGSNAELRNSIITVVPDEYSVEEDKFSAFLKLAFWKKNRSLIDHDIIRFHPIYKKKRIAIGHSVYETYFPDNEIPVLLGKRINNALVDKPISKVTAIAGKDNFYFDPKNRLHIKLSCDSIKNYFLAILSNNETRKQLRGFTKIYQVRDFLNKSFIEALKNSYYNIFGKKPNIIKVHINNQPELPFEDILSFMIYACHACNIMTITCVKDDDIKISFSKDTRPLWDKYSQLLQPVSFSKWGE